MEKIMEHLLSKIGLCFSIVLIVCLFPMPYGYYMLVRFVAMILFGCMAFDFYHKEKLPLCITAGALALLFQPFVKIALGRFMWNVVDVFVATALVLLWYWQNRKP